jgi:hypothetical protein
LIDVKLIKKEQLQRDQILKKLMSKQKKRRDNKILFRGSLPEFIGWGKKRETLRLDSKKWGTLFWENRIKQTAS